MMPVSLRVLLLSAVAWAAQACTTDLSCSLNGVCQSGTCQCDKPWSGTSCGVLKYKTTPASGKNLYNTSDPRNTWNGPIVTAPDGKLFHLYDPIYRVGSLGGPTAIKHGTADAVTGPYNWHHLPDMPAGGENPAFVVFKNESTGRRVYSLWMGGTIRVAEDPAGPFSIVKGWSYPGGNPAPLYHKGAFYLTNQRTDTVWTTQDLRSKWTKYSTISHAALHNETIVEDPFMWIDARGSWHIINHAYNNWQWQHCGNSTHSAHFFSRDGRQWNILQNADSTNIDPYTATVEYDDGTSHTYTTLERPNLHFDARGQLTHINLAADLIVGDEGCGSRTKHAHNGHTPCDNCKWDDHAGTTIIALDV